MLRFPNSEMITGFALVFLAILFFYAAGAKGGYWAALIGYGIDYVLIALGAGFIAHGIWTERTLSKTRTEEPHH